MNREPCRLCKMEVSTDQESCPNCGLPRGMAGGLATCFYCKNRVYEYIESGCPRCGVSHPLVPQDEYEVMQEIAAARQEEQRCETKYTKLGDVGFLKSWFVEKERKEYIRQANIALYKAQDLQRKLDKMVSERRSRDEKNI